MNVNTELEFYKDKSDLKKLSMKDLKFILHSNTAWNAEEPCMYEYYKLDWFLDEIWLRQSYGI